MKNILVVGDSFSYGQGCSDRPWNQKPYKASPSQFAWPALLQKELPEYNIINISYPGNSIPGTFNDVVKFRETVPQIPIHSRVFQFSRQSSKRLMILLRRSQRMGVNLAASRLQKPT